MGKHAKLKEKQKWSHEKLHLDNARKLRGIYFIDPEDKEFKETIKNARKKLETSVAPAMPCKIMKNCGSGASNKIKTKLACILEADESTRLRMGESLPNHHEDHIAGKGDNSPQHDNFVHKFIPMPQAMKFQQQRQGRNAKLREKQKWSIGKPKLDNAGRLRGIYFIDPEDKELKETIGSARKKLETPMAPAVPCTTCKKNKNGETRSKTNDFKSKFACILEASESSRMRMEESLPNNHEDNSLQHYNLVHNFIPVPQAMKIPAAKAAVDKEWEKLEKIPAWDLTKVRSESEVIDEARTKGVKVHFASLMDICFDVSGSYAVFSEQGSSASQVTASKVMDIISRLPGCAGQAADAVSAYTQVKMEDAPK